MNPLGFLTTVAAVGAATVGGVMFAFSSFVMPGLSRLPPAEGVAAMQQLNVTAVRPPLMIAIFGTAAVCLAGTVAAVVLSTTGGASRRRVLLGIGALLYLIGGVGVTAAVNVPLNDALATLDPAGVAAERWHDWVRNWTAANHARTVLCLASAALLTASLLPGDD